MRVAFFEQKEAWEWEPGLLGGGEGGVGVGGNGSAAPLALFPGHQAPKRETGCLLSPVCYGPFISESSKQLSQHHFLWPQTSAEENMLRYFIAEGTPVFVVTLIFFGKLPFQFLIWFSVLESPPLGQSPGTQSSSWSRSLRSCLHYTAALSVLRPKPPWTDKVPCTDLLCPAHISRFIVSVVF